MLTPGPEFEGELNMVDHELTPDPTSAELEETKSESRGELPEAPKHS